MATEPRAWTDITVEVKADQPVATAQRLKEQADGFHRLSITLSNPGKQPLTIEKITVRIPVAEPLTDDLEMLYGGSCMGQTPLLRQNVGTQTNLSSSHMYEMVRLADGQYLFAGSLSWRMFLPNFTLQDGAFVVWSNGEGRQLKPGETIQYEQIVLRRAGNWLDLLNQFGSGHCEGERHQQAQERRLQRLGNVGLLRLRVFRRRHSRRTPRRSRRSALPPTWSR